MNIVYAHKKLCQGPIVRVSPSEVEINDIAAIKQIHKVGGQFLKSDWYHILTTKDKDAENLFNTTDSGYHSRLRKLLSSPISENNLKQYEGIVTDRILLAIRRVAEEIESRGVADIYKWMTFLTTDIIGELTFGKSFQMLERGEVCWLLHFFTLSALLHFLERITPRLT